MDFPGWGFIVRRAVSALTDGAGASFVSRSAQEANVPANATSDFIDKLRLSAAKPIRISIITLASFDVLAAATTLACVLWDCYAAAKKNNPGLRFRDLRLTLVSSPQVYPLVLSCGIVVQGIIFAAGQARGLESLLIHGCVSISQTMMPAIFLVPYIQFIFGAETALRAVLRPSFAPRKKWVVPVCIAIIVAGLIALYAVTVSLPPPDLCFASLFWYAQAWRPVCFGLLTGIAVALLVGSGVVFFRLRQSRDTDAIERVAASHMVYYMVTAAISNALLTPFFFSIKFSDEDKTPSHPMELSTVASIIANLSGLTTGGLYLFLRGGRVSASHTHKDDIFHPEDPENGKSREISDGRVGPNPPQQPPSPSLYSQSGNEELHHKFYRDRGGHGFVVSSENVKGRFSNLTNPLTSSLFSNLKGPSKLSINRGTMAPSRRSSFSFFSQNSPNVGSSSPGLLPSTTYTPASSERRTPTPKLETMLVPPPLFHAPGMSWHHRNSSVESSATVQIGLRISNMNDVRTSHSAQNHPLRQTPGLDPPTIVGQPVSDKSIPAAEAVGGNARRELLDEAGMNKKLPETPRGASAPRKEEQEPQLSPSVYEPQKQPPRVKLVSPKGVGFQAPMDGTARQNPQVRPTPNCAEKFGWI